MREWAARVYAVKVTQGGTSWKISWASLRITHAQCCAYTTKCGSDDFSLSRRMPSTNCSCEIIEPYVHVGRYIVNEHLPPWERCFWVPPWYMKLRQRSEVCDWSSGQFFGESVLCCVFRALKISYWASVVFKWCLTLPIKLLQCCVANHCKLRYVSLKPKHLKCF